MPPEIWPRSAILQSVAASIVAGILGLIVSTAASTATFGAGFPSQRARSIAFWQISRFSESPGAMLIIVSVMNNGLGYVGISSACTWLMRRSVRRPFVVEMI